MATSQKELVDRLPFLDHWLTTMVNPRLQVSQGNTRERGPIVL